MRLTEIARTQKNPFPQSKITVPVYHGTNEKFSKFRRPPHGVFFTPHKYWALEHYGNNVLTCFINVPKLYVLRYGKEFDEEVLGAFFDRDYNLLHKYIEKLKSKGYNAMQAPGDSEMICVFENAQIINADTGKEM